jgi:hypothetical protein
MEIKKIHNVEIYINTLRADIYSQDDLNLRFNNTFADPSKISTIQTEYSFSFTLPVTPQNQKIFDFADIPSKRNKFNKYFKTHISADGMMIFDGDLILQSISKEGYKCNLYVNRLNTVEKIFGETTLNEIEGWLLDYDQDITINQYNDGDIEYGKKDIFYPLVSYGLFQKLPMMNESYTSKFYVDNYCRLYNENFYPSFNLLSLVERCFNMKGYTVDGDIFDDKVLRKIYTSTPLADEQDPTYNFGKDSLGKFSMDFTFTNYVANTTNYNGVSLKSDQFATSIPVKLNTPMYSSSKNSNDMVYYNWEYNNVYDIWSQSNVFLNKTFNKPNNILWRENRLVAPADGWYKIHLKLDYKINQNIKFKRGFYYGGEEKTVKKDGTWDFYQFPIEFQILKNDADGTSARLIAPDFVDELTSFNYKDGKLTTEKQTLFDYRNLTSFPHEGTWVDLIGNIDINNPTQYLGGYTAQNGQTLCYDPSVNPNFIMGCTTTGEYTYTSVIKNGKSWKLDCTDVGQARYVSAPYWGAEFTTSGINNVEVSKNRYNENTLPNSTMKITRNSNSTSASTTVEAIVFLKKNDYLQLKMLERQWTNKDDVADWNYGNKSQDDAVVNVSGNIAFECFAPYDKLQVDGEYMNWTKPSLFPTMLNIGEFLPKDEKMSDFINNFIKEFNLSYQQNGKNITLNKQFIDFKTKNAVDLSDRDSRDEIEMEAIDFPSKMSVQYTINEEERGFYVSAEKNATDEQIQSSSWKDYADRGYDVIDVMPDEWANESKVQTKTSYNWFEKFTFFYDNDNVAPTQMTRAAVMNPENKPVMPEVPDGREDEFVEGGGGGVVINCATINYTLQNGAKGTFIFKDLFGNILTSQYVSENCTKKICGIASGKQVWVEFSEKDVIITGNGWPYFNFANNKTINLTARKLESLPDVEPVDPTPTGDTSCMVVNYYLIGNVKGTLTFKTIDDTLLASKYITTNGSQSLCGVRGNTEITVSFDQEDVEVGTPSFTFIGGGTEMIFLTKEDSGGGGGGGSTGDTEDNEDYEDIIDPNCMTINYTIVNGAMATVVFETLFQETITTQFVSSEGARSLCDIAEGTQIWPKVSAEDVIISGDWPTFNYTKGGVANITLTKVTEGGGGGGSDTGSTTGSTGTTTGTTTGNIQSKVLSLPVIGKDEWYIEGYKYAEMMKYDGHNMKRRYWFPSDYDSGVHIYLNGDNTKPVKVKLVADTYDNVNLSYKESKGDIETLLTRYFNIFYDADTNYIKFECYLTTEEYLAIKNGSNIIVDDDVYIPIELKGYDVSGGNTTEIKAIKK